MAGGVSTLRRMEKHKQHTINSFSTMSISLQECVNKRFLWGDNRFLLNLKLLFFSFFMINMFKIKVIPARTFLKFKRQSSHSTLQLPH